ncbi:MAG: sugar transferase [Lachnospiraceae bacterium]|nr:sugar transferase [Lachnospiraceae bacterium]
MNEKKKRGWLKHGDFMLVDLICIELAYLLAYNLRQPGMIIYRGLSLYIHLNVILIVIDICYVLLRPVYKNIIKRSALKEIQSVLLHNLVMWMLAITYLYLTKQAFWFSRLVMGMSIFLCVVFMLVGRICWKAVVRTILKKGKYQANILLVSSKDYSVKMLKRFRERMYNGFNLKGLAIVDAEMVGDKVDRIPVVCDSENLLNYVKQEAIDEVMISIPGNTEGNRVLVYQLLNMGVVVHLAVDYGEDEFPNATMERIGGFNFLTTSINSSGSIRLAIKRLIDIAAGLVGCAAMGIAFLFVAPAIYRASPGPIFFKQERMGKNGRRFQMYKFRSMYLDAEERKKELMKQNEMDGLMFKMDNDPRIIGSEKGPGKGIGNVIRRLSIDELPQFINILKGDMSLVGTRPPTAGEFEQYDYHHKVRLSMKPGLTGLWQVSGRSKITDFEEIVRLDATYIQNWSLWLDFKIIFKTFKVVLKREGAE